MSAGVPGGTITDRLVRVGSVGLNVVLAAISSQLETIVDLIDTKLDASEKGAPNGVAELDGSGFVLTAQLPSYVDDVLVFANLAAFPGTGETGKIYVATDTNLTYRWSGSAYVEISASLALGETSGTAYRGDRGKIAYDFSQGTVPIGQIPTGTSGTQVPFGNDSRFSDDRTPTSAGLAATIHGATSKGTPVDADELALVDSAASNGPKKLTWANVKATLKTYFDTLYAPILTTVSALTPTTGTVNLDMAAVNGTYLTHALSGAPTFTTSNRAAGRTVTIRVVCDGTNRNLTFPAWVFLGTAPTSIAAGKTGILTVTFFGTADTDAVAAWAVQS